MNQHNDEAVDKNFKDDFKKRIKEVKTTRWIRFGIVSLIFFLWVAWLGNWWVSLAYILLFDIYITGYIPLTWWKKSKNATVRTVMSWVDAILYALVLVYFVFIFIGQNYQIPSSSLEKSLLVGDYLWVNKMAYGPRVPNTPLHFPLVQNTLPILNTKSYIEWPQWSYHRLKGLGNVERGDIVVFNVPSGDTVSTKITNPDYYTLVKMFGRYAVHNDKERFGDIIYRPVDRRENYVKRAIGLPGERIKIVDGTVYIDGKPLEAPKNVQFNYWFQVKERNLTDAEWDDLGISADDRHIVPLSPEDAAGWQSIGFNVSDDGKGPTIYGAPLTAEMIKKLRANPNITNIAQIPATPEAPGFLYPEGVADNWTRADYAKDIHPQGLWIPRKGATIALNARTWAIYNRAIKNYEHNNDAYLDGDTVYIGGKPAKTYTFKMDYYFMLGDNRDNSLDSRYWGFVPEDHVVGKPMVVLVSFDKDKSLFNGGIRWERVFKKANPDK